MLKANVKKIKKVTGSLLVCGAMVFSSIANVSAFSACMSVSPLSSKTVSENGSLMFVVKYSNDIKSIDLSVDDFTLQGFTGDILVQPHGNHRIVMVSNIQNSPSQPNPEKRIFIQGSTATSSDGKDANYGMTETFRIE